MKKRIENLEKEVAELKEQLMILNDIVIKKNTFVVSSDNKDYTYRDENGNLRTASFPTPNNASGFKYGL